MSSATVSSKAAQASASTQGEVPEKNVYGRRLAGDIACYTLLTILGIIWIVPIVWVFMESFNKNPQPYQTSFFPQQFSLDNYVKLFTDTSSLDFPRMYMNTLIIAIFTCVISVFFVLAVAYCMSRLRFRMRRTFMNVVLILGMFPAIMAVVAIYFILKAVGLTSSNTTIIALILVYSAGSGAGFYVMKGYMDTIPFSLDEAARLDGCNNWQVFTKIIIPIARPMIVYQAIVSFLGPWLDFVLAKAIATTAEGYTVSLGLWSMLQKEYIHTYYARFAAGAVLVSIPIAILFMVMQRFYQESMSGATKG